MYCAALGKEVSDVVVVSGLLGLDDDDAVDGDADEDVDAAVVVALGFDW